MGALQDQTEVNILEWAGRRKQKGSSRLVTLGKTGRLVASLLKLHLVAPETIHGQGERQSCDTVGPAFGVPGYLLLYRDAVRTQLGDVEPEVSGWISVQTL